MFYKPSVTQIYLAAICRVCCIQQRFDMKVKSWWLIVVLSG